MCGRHDPQTTMRAFVQLIQDQPGPTSKLRYTTLS